MGPFTGSRVEPVTFVMANRLTGRRDNRVRFGHPIIDLARESLVDPYNGDRHQGSLAQRPCPAMIRNSSSIRIGFMKPNRSIRLICRLKCVRALRGHGFSASVES